MKRQLSIRQSLLLGLILLILFTSGALLISTVLSAFQASKVLAREVIGEAGELVAHDVENYFGEVERSLRVVAGWAKANDLGPSDFDEIASLLKPLISEHPNVSSAMVANVEGAEIMFLQDPVQQTHWTTRVVDPNRWPGRGLVREWTDGVNEESKEAVFIDYDTVNRLYFQTALTSTSLDAPAWTPPSVFFVTRDPGMTAGVNWTGANGETNILGLDVLLLDLSRMTSAMEISRHGAAFIVTSDSLPRILGIPGGREEMDDDEIRVRLLPEAGNVGVADTVPELPVAGNSGIAALDAAIQSWESLGRPNDSVPFEFEGENWWAHLKPITAGNNTLFVGCMAPESDFLGGLSETTRRISLVAMLAFLVALFIATRLASSYARPLEELAEASRRLQSLDLTPSEGIQSRVREIKDLENEQERTRMALGSFARYMPVEIVRNLVARGVAAKLGGERRVITILFTDIRGFTSIAERHSAEEVTVLLTDYFDALIQTIRSHGGEVNELLGDGVVAYWGAPTPHEDHASMAISAILDIQVQMLKLGERASLEGRPVLPTCCGVSSGEVVIGNIGSASRLAYKAVGDTANLASRIEGLNRVYDTQMLVSGQTKQLSGDDFEWREIDAVRVKGRTEPTHLFEPLGRRGEVEQDRLTFRDHYEAALSHYRQGRFELAIQELGSAMAFLPKDGPSIRLLALSKDHLESGKLPEDWDGVSTFVTK